MVSGAQKRGRQGRARRPLARRIDHDRVRDLGLQRARRAPTTSPASSTSTAAAARADHAPTRRRSRCRPEPRLAVAGLRRDRGAVRRPLQRGRRRRPRMLEPERAVARPDVAAAAGEPQAAGPRRRTRASTASRSTPRPRRRPGRRAGAPRATSPRAATRAAGTAPASSPRSSASRTMFSGTGLKGLDGTAWYHPHAADDRRRRGRRRQRATPRRRCSTSRDPRRTTCRSACGSTRSARRSAASACSTPRRRWPSSRSIPRGNLTLVNRSATYAHNDPNSAAPEERLPEAASCRSSRDRPVQAIVRKPSGRAGDGRQPPYGERLLAPPRRRRSRADAGHGPPPASPCAGASFGVLALALLASGPWLGWWTLFPLALAGSCSGFADTRIATASSHPEYALLGGLGRLAADDRRAASP